MCTFLFVYIEIWQLVLQKINFSDIVHYVTGHTDTKASFLLHNVMYTEMLAGLFIGGALARFWFVNAK